MKTLPDFADILEEIAGKVRKKKPLKFFLYLEDEDDAFSVPYTMISNQDMSDEAYHDLMMTEQIEMVYRLARHLDLNILYQIARERIEFEDSGELENLVTFH